MDETHGLVRGARTVLRHVTHNALRPDLSFTVLPPSTLPLSARIKGNNGPPGALGPGEPAGRGPSWTGTPGPWETWPLGKRGGAWIRLACERQPPQTRRNCGHGLRLPPQKSDSAQT
ncbi:hypothetical protein SKAU_G00112610 [Synaphobranchus kaupii]|uniref:Uncharacterized protein n=1 Tax=Synaphobranchus kaupii TaxID=118154 RepID=A0A9Q1G1I6_SYNKA|nr:hypothetical protein SKAU_G00112610 [Synaphobranchus kaupii]